MCSLGCNSKESTLVQVMAWCWMSIETLNKAMLILVSDAIWCHKHNEFTHWNMKREVTILGALHQALHTHVYCHKNYVYIPLKFPSTICLRISLTISHHCLLPLVHQAIAWTNNEQNVWCRLPMSHKSTTRLQHKSTIFSYSPMHISSIKFLFH